jgi:hypothetical protein
VRRRAKPAKTPEQIERERERAREAVRRHRALRAEQKQALRPQARAIGRVTGALREMIFGKVSPSRYSGGKVRTWDRTDELARALFDALGSASAAKLVTALRHEVKIGGTTARRHREFVERYGDQSPADAIRSLMGGSTP